MRALCQLLLEQQQVLLACSNHDLLRRIQLPLRQWYMLQPAADGSGLLLRWVASREQLLPPMRRDSSALGSTVGCAAAAAAGECFENEVVLLDAEQLEAVRDSLAGLKGLGGSSSSSSVGGIGEEQQSALEADGVESGCCGAGAAAEDVCVQADRPGEAGDRPQGPVQVQPLLLSCGLDEWVSAVLGASSATYTPPAFDPAAVAAAPAGQYMQHGGLAAAAAAGAITAGAAAVATTAAAQTAGAGAAQQLMQRPHPQEGPGGGSHVAGSTGPHSGVPGAGGVGGAQQPGCRAEPVSAGMCPPAAAAAAGFDHPDQPRQHQGHAEGGGVAAESGSRAGGGGRAGGRGRRNSNVAAATGRKLRLSKV